mmetsp:Transcript_152959/g.292949  ORF Transcript_152959/g.292949 Transcript_152959/m.292949 type:complete len:255 (+) Transcript_152959:2-766(+)
MFSKGRSGMSTHQFAAAMAAKMSLSSLLAMGRADAPARAAAAGCGCTSGAALPVTRTQLEIARLHGEEPGGETQRMVQEQLEIARAFEMERQEEWEEHRAVLKARQAYEERRELEVAADLAAASVFEGQWEELVAQQDLCSSSSSTLSRSSSEDSSESNSNRSASLQPVSDGSPTGLPGEDRQEEVEKDSGTQPRGYSRSRSRSPPSSLNSRHNRDNVQLDMGGSSRPPLPASSCDEPSTVDSCARGVSQQLPS